ncbi:MAG: Dolichyl-phosphate beta-D-mannosyltransferase [Microgenomates group bacterium GW2011_GWA2_44_7]|nr:MAG: Dolichyl-phosphate beta-D-mannosyltransferase [Microgenomates group bacterium GW2011_GWA2_44_7]KKT78393.1 MAG: Dolichyl-phosphate beta-D-mannosyltransferase [Microgenomates group bacterium GW2011_GWB1_44_8]
MSSERTVGLVIPAYDKQKTPFERGLLHEILDNVPSQVNPRIYVVVNNATSGFRNYMNKLAERESWLRVIHLPNPSSFGLAYLRGYQAALNDSVELAVEIDGNGSHKPSYLPGIIEPIIDGSVDGVYTTRFSHGGGVDRYPLQRKLISLVGTVVGNALLLGTGVGWVSDLTSGLQGFSARSLSDLFSVSPPDQFVSVWWGPGYAVQGELRVKFLWRGNRVLMIPMIWGSDRVDPPQGLPMRVPLRALLGQLLILRERGRIANSVNKKSRIVYQSAKK